MSPIRSAVLITFATLPLLCSCGVEDGNGLVTTQQRQLKSFDKVEVSDGLTVNIVNGEQRVTVTTDEDLQNNLVTDVDGDTLKIRLSNNESLAPTVLTIGISTPALQRLTVTGRSSVNAQATQAEDWRLKVDDHSIARVSGIGGAQVHVDVNNKSQAEISGFTNELFIDCHDASSLNAEGLTAVRAKVDVGGASQVNVFASQDIEIDSSGNSRVFISGNPAQRDITADDGSQIVFGDAQAR